MQNENKQPHWKEKLNDADTLLPEHALNKEVSWEVLQQRLQNRTKRRKARLYWVAAASLLPLFFVMAIILLQNKSGDLHPVAHQNIITKPSPLPRFNSLPEQKIVSYPETTITVKKITSKHNEEKKAGVKYANQSTISLTDSAAPEDVMISSPSADSIATTPSIAIQQKKKLPVVHINELSEPVTTIPVIVQNGNRHYFPLQIAHGEVVGKEIKTILATSFINFKATSPTN